MANKDRVPAQQTAEESGDPVSANPVQQMQPAASGQETEGVGAIPENLPDRHVWVVELDKDGKPAAGFSIHEGALDNRAWEHLKDEQKFIIKKKVK